MLECSENHIQLVQLPIPDPVGVNYSVSEPAYTSLQSVLKVFNVAMFILIIDREA